MIYINDLNLICVLRGESCVPNSDSSDASGQSAWSPGGGGGGGGLGGELSSA